MIVTIYNNSVILGFVDFDHRTWYVQQGNPSSLEGLYREAHYVDGVMKFMDLEQFTIDFIEIVYP